MTNISIDSNRVGTVTPRQVAFVFDNLLDWRALAAAVHEGVELVVLDGAKDGLDQIAAHLQGRSDIGAIHILSHGEAGRVQLGSSSVGVQEVQARADLMARIGESLSDDGDVLLYGCNVAAGEEGRDFVNLLATATGVNIAASNSLTGATDLGGNWDLEVHKGSITTASLNGAALRAYSGVLAPPADENYDQDIGFNSTYINTFSLNGITYTTVGTPTTPIGGGKW